MTTCYVQFFGQHNMRRLRFKALLDTGAPLTLLPVDLLEEQQEAVKVNLRGCSDVTGGAPTDLTFTLPISGYFKEPLSGVEGEPRDFCLIWAYIEIKGLVVPDLSHVSFHYDRRKDFAIIGRDILLPRDSSNPDCGVCFSTTGYRGRLCPTRDRF